MTLEQHIQELETLVHCLLAENAELKAAITAMKAENAAMKATIVRLEVPKKDSSNSSVPPSQDPFRSKRTESLREKSGKKSGGQPGHEGSTLQLSDTPTEIIQYHPDLCTVCGKGLSGISAEFSGKRQVIDIPVIVPVITEHQIYRKVCSCGCCNESKYPDAVHSTVCYGKNLMSLSAYFHSRQYLPYDRMREMFQDIFGVDISNGSLVNLVHRFAQKAYRGYDVIKHKISHSAVVGADETGVCVAGKNQWAWTFQTDRLTCIAVDPSRGKKAIGRIFKDGLPRSALVHDCWKPYFTTAAQAHQICTAHLLRELKYLQKLHPDDTWSSDFGTLLKDALALKQKLSPGDCYRPMEKRTILEDRLNELLNRSIDPGLKKLLAFRNRIACYKQHLFLFLHRWDVPPDNNGSERAVKTFKVKQKASGLFRSTDGALAFAVIRSVIDTTIKNQQNVWQALALIAIG